MTNKQLTHARTAVYNVNYHFVWCVKYRRNVLLGAVSKRLKEILLEIAPEKDFSVRSIEVMPDHVHVFASAHPKFAPGYLYKMLKGICISARRLFVEFPHLKSTLWKGRLWNPATYREALSQISEETIIRYIEDQKSR